MTTLAIILLIFGIVFLLLEMWLTGTEFFAIAGIGSLIISAVLAIMFVPNGWIIVIGQVLAIAGFLLYMYRFMNRKQLRGKLILTENLETLPTTDTGYLVGREGKTLTALRPYGEADFNGTRFEVSSTGPMIEEGVKVRVTEIVTNKIIVQPVAN
ncbi:MAG: hypothetical protein FWG68_02100 [Defluviitaleaceae bacterium]|nr:hypothetical protein [Defluviitaleaceae bacterium]